MDGAAPATSAESLPTSATDENGCCRKCGRLVRSTHPTVKPVDLMRWLCRLITPPGGRILDPFAGSGSTLVAALMEGFAATGIEREPEYIRIAQMRIDGIQVGLF
jgi:site-specific DNA-methyltransferase (adenine-specific)